MEIHNIVVDDKIINNIVKAIKDKPKLQNMDEILILEEIKKFLDNNVNHMKKLNNPKAKEYKELVKYVRMKCHDIFEIFQTKASNKDRLKMIENLEDLSLDSHIEILNTHLSTKERVDFYTEVYKEISNRIGKFNTILDIGCGYNPLAIPFLKTSIDELKYYASDLSQEDLDVIQRYFIQIGLIQGETFRCNLVKEYELLENYPADVCFAFKLFDVLETQKKNISYKIIEKIKCNWLIASFPLNNIKQEKMAREKVHYFERMLTNMELSFDSFEINNEIFYIVKNG